MRPLRATLAHKNSTSWLAIYFSEPVKMAHMPCLLDENGTHTSLQLNDESRYSPIQVFRLSSSRQVKGTLHFPSSCAISTFDEMSEYTVEIDLDESRSQVVWNLPRTDCSVCMPKDAWERRRQSITDLLEEEKDCKCIFCKGNYFCVANDKQNRGSPHAHSHLAASWWIHQGDSGRIRETSRHRSV